MMLFNRWQALLAIAWLSGTRSVIQYPQSGTDYSAHRAWTNKFLQDERSAEIDYTTCVWTAKFENGSRDCPDPQVVVGIECASTNCHWKKLRCCSVKGRYKTCVASYNGPVVETEPFNDQTVGMIASAHNGRAGTDVQSGQTVYLSHFFVTGLSCAGKNCHSLTLRNRKLYCSLGYIIENAVDEMRGSARECKWSAWFSSSRRAPIPPYLSSEPKDGTAISCGKNRVLTGVECKGANCQRIRMYCCNFGHVCPVGSYGNNERCAPCPRGRYGQTPGLLDGACTGPCPAGKYGPYTGASLPQCPKLHAQISTGYDANDPFGGEAGGGRSGTRNCCIDCPAGRYLDATGEDDIWDCKPCPMGKYGATDGLQTSACTANCAIGRYRDKTGGILPQDCTYCPPGTWGQSTGLVTYKCTDFCPPGKYNSRVGKTSSVDCIDCPITFTGSKAPWGEQCVHRMPTRAIGRGTSHPKEYSVPDSCGNPLGEQGPYKHAESTTGNQGTNIKCFGDFVDYGKSHPIPNSHNQIDDTAFHLTRMGYPRFCDTKTMCLNVGSFQTHNVAGAHFPGGEATTKWGPPNQPPQTGGTRTPWITNKGTKRLGMSEKVAQKYFITDWTGPKVYLGYP
jgi:hypothetical protein